MNQCADLFPPVCVPKLHSNFFYPMNQWEPSTLGEVQDEKIDLVFHPFGAELELQVPAEGEACRLYL